MSAKTTRYLIASQLSLFVFMGICVALTPGFLFSHDEGGVSNYATYARTVLPFTLMLLLEAAFVLLAARDFLMSSAVARRFKKLLYCLGTLILVTMLSTYAYRINIALRDVHILTSIAFLLFELGTAYWAAFILLRTRIGYILFGFELLGFLLAAITLIGIITILFIAQILSSLAFGILLVYCAQQLSVQAERKDKDSHQ